MYTLSPISMQLVHYYDLYENRVRYNINTTNKVTSKNVII